MTTKQGYEQQKNFEGQVSSAIERHDNACQDYSGECSSENLRVDTLIRSARCMSPNAQVARSMRSTLGPVHARHDAKGSSFFVNRAHYSGRAYQSQGRRTRYIRQDRYIFQRCALHKQHYHCV